MDGVRPGGASRGPGKRFELTEVQVDKLRLAGRGDIKRFFAEVEEEQRRFDLIRADPARAFKHLESMDGLAESFRLGPFRRGSLFVRTMTRKIEGRR